MFRVGQDDLIGDGTNHRIRSIFAQMSGGAGSSGSKRIFEVVYFAVLFRGRAMTSGTETGTHLVSTGACTVNCRRY